MPEPALSLLGFMDQQTALAYMTNNCVFPNNDPTLLTQHWQAAQQQLGTSTPNAGYPQVQSLQHPHLQGVLANPNFGTFFGQVQWEFAVVEVDTLLAFQLHVLTGHAQQRCAGLPLNPSVDDMLPICLCQVFPQPSYQTYCQPQGVIVEAPDMDVLVYAQGPLNLNPDPAFHIMGAGILYGQPNPWVTVTECQGRYYLTNGYHRALGLRQLGATSVPCILVHASDITQIGIKGGGLTFNDALLTSADPPTCSHFANNRAYAVDVKHMRKRLVVTWNVWELPE